MGPTSFLRKLGLSLASLAICSMTLLQVNPSFAAANPQGRQVNMVLSQGQLATLAKQDYALYRHVLDAYRSGSRLVVSERQYQVLSHLKTAYLGYARAGQACPPNTTLQPDGKCAVNVPASAPAGATAGAPASTCPVPTSGPLVPTIQAMCSDQGPIKTLAQFLAAIWPPLAAIPAVFIIAVLVLVLINDLIVLLQPPAAPATK